MTKNRVVLGIDLDQVCLDYTGGFRKYLMENFGGNEADYPRPVSYCFKESGWKLDEKLGYTGSHGQAVEDGLYTQLKPLPGAPEALQRLSDMGYHNRVITTRFVNHGQHSKVLSQTAESLDQAGIPYRDIMFTGHKYEIHADVYFDDSPHNIERLRAHGKHAVVFTAPYNLDIDGPRVNNWEEAERYVLENFPL